MVRKSKVIVLLIPCLFITAFIAHRFIRYPADTARLFFSVEAAFVTATTPNCSDGAPDWMADLLIASTKERGSLANQIAYKDPSGKLHHCENGRVGNVLFSEPVSQSNRYRYASITKLITADLILRLVNEKRLALDTRLVEIFPEVRPTGDDRINQITISQLLNHTAGFNRSTPAGDLMFWSAKKNWCPYHIEKLSNERLNFTPGEKQIYSNLGYCLLGAVIEKVSGTNYADLAEKYYGLAQYNIKFVDGPYLLDEVRYDFRHDHFHKQGYYKRYDLQANRAVAGASGSASALVRLVDKIFKSSGVNLTESPKYSGCDNRQLEKCYGYAVRHYQPEVDGLYLYLHTGYLPGSSSILVADDKGGILVLLNAGSALNIAAANDEMINTMYKLLKKQYASF